MTADDNGNHFDEGWTIRTLKHFFQQALDSLHKLLDEREKRYSEKFEAMKDAAAALDRGYKEAIEKADKSYDAYKAEANNTRATMNDWQANTAKNMVTKGELIGLEGKIFAVIDTLRKQLEGTESTLRALIDGHGELIKELQLSKSRREGESEQRSSSRTQSNFIVGLAITVVLGLIANMVTIGLVMYKIFSAGKP